MKKGLVIGGSGFVAKYLIEAMNVEGWECYATKLTNENYETACAKIYELNILDKDAIASLLFEVRPDYIFHLAAQSSVGLAWKNPGLTIDVNIKGTVNVLDAVRELYYKPRVLLVGSGEEYGHIFPNEIPITETNHLQPGNIYAATKACQNMIGNIYTKAYDMEIVMTRSFNHIGPGQLPTFVVSDFCKQVAEIEKGNREPRMKVGNLAAMRDFTDVRDVVNAYIALIQLGESGATYNVGRGKAVSIQEILDIILSFSNTPISVEMDPAKIRPVDVPIIEADICKINKLTGWKPQIDLKQTIIETLNYWRNEVSKED